MSPTAVEVERMTVRFGDFTAVDDISFAVPRGEIFGFLGANGAGKTTTIRVLCGLLIPSEGRVRVAGIDLIPSRETEVKTKVGYMSQKFTLYDDLSVAENLDFAAGLRKLEPRAEAGRRRELLQFIEFDKPLTTRVRDLAGGMKQQVALAAALLHDPEIVFLDEPTAGVSPAARARFWDLIRRLAGEGRTMFVTSHYMDEVENCQRIALMRTGRIVALDTPTALKKSTFDKPLYEISPLHEESVAALKDFPFEYLEPYGLRSHGSFSSPASEAEFRERFAGRFELKPITPSLEDVFIRRVEGATP